jgi:hypothetical protein
LHYKLKASIDVQILEITGQREQKYLWLKGEGKGKVVPVLN